LLLEETSTFGVRHQLLLRYVAGRAFVEVATPWGPVRAKAKLLDGEVVSLAPEYEACARAAREAGVPLAQVYEAVLAGYRAGAVHPLDKQGGW
ncbi:MAG: nickel insertion protein, partial [Anaerolineae bacterium]